MHSSHLAPHGTIWGQIAEGEPRQWNPRLLYLFCCLSKMFIYIFAYLLVDYKVYLSIWTLILDYIFVYFVRFIWYTFILFLLKKMNRKVTKWLYLRNRDNCVFQEFDTLIFLRMRSKKPEKLHKLCGTYICMYRKRSKM